MCVRCRLFLHLLLCHLLHLHPQVAVAIVAACAAYIAAYNSVIKSCCCCCCCIFICFPYCCNKHAFKCNYGPSALSLLTAFPSLASTQSFFSCNNLLGFSLWLLILCIALHFYAPAVARKSGGGQLFTFFVQRILTSPRFNAF